MSHAPQPGMIVWRRTRPSGGKRQRLKLLEQIYGNQQTTAKQESHQPYQDQDKPANDRFITSYPGDSGETDGIEEKECVSGLAPAYSGKG